MQNERERLIDEALALRHEVEEAWSPRKPGCPPIAALLDVLLGQAPPPLVTAVQDHLAGCRDCRQRMTMFQAFLQDEEVPEPAREGSLLEMVARSEDSPGAGRIKPAAKVSPEPVSPGSGYTELSLNPQDWPKLCNRLRPWVPYVLRRVGLDQEQANTQAEAFVNFLLAGRLAEVSPTRRFRDLLPGWIQEFGRQQRLNLTLPLKPEDWLDVLRASAAQEAFDSVMQQPAPGETGRLKNYREQLRGKEELTSAQSLREYRSEDELAGDRTVAEYRRRLAAASEQRELALLRDLELLN